VTSVISFQSGLKSLAIILSLVVICSNVKAQKVGVVLSGGGATALAHVGFLRALEENNIPIDYICGTSMGAVVAGLYASGYSVQQIDSLVKSREFNQMSTGEFDDKLKFYFKNNDPDVGIATLKYSEGKFISNAIPTNLIDPVLLDWKLMEGFGAPEAAANYNFDSLYIPFRCIAADVEHKRQVVFRKGSLAEATRASATYPFYLPARLYNGILLYDGGIYNNFPADVLYRDFMPDVIIGCNVSGDSPKPDVDDLFSQLQSMILFRDPIADVCEDMIVIRPNLPDLGTFDFDNVNRAVQEGYRATLDSIQLILDVVPRRISALERTTQRNAFKKKQSPLIIEGIEITGLDKGQDKYVKKIMGRKQSMVPLARLKVPYFRVFEDDKIRSVYPTTKIDTLTKKYVLHLNVKKEKDLFMTFGGNFSSRSINTGFVGMRYNLFGRSSATLFANSYFGRFYASAKAGIRWDISGALPISIQGSITQNRWDYYRSYTTFFEDVKPSYVLLNERFANLSFTIPAGNKGMLRADVAYAYIFDRYYQTPHFSSKDTADKTNFDAGVFRATWERSTLNKIQYANAGTYLSISAKYVTGRETSIPGSTSEIQDTTLVKHHWLLAKLSYTNYFVSTRNFHFGIQVEGVASTQGFFQNYISSAIIAPVYQPIVESKTYFLPQFRAYNYAAGGFIGVVSFTKNLDLRAEVYGFNAFGRIGANDVGATPVFNYTLKQYYIGSAALVYHSPIGPISVSSNYYGGKENPWSVLFNLGFVMFNHSARD
jgi:NTE family protein